MKSPRFPKISIVTPNYNYGHFLEETILSILNQGYPNLELIIIDGGSTDNSVDIIRKYEKQLAYWVSEPDKGVYDAVNKGLKKSTGDIMAYLNSDDIHLPWCLQTVAEIFVKLPEVSWLSTLQPGYIDHRSKSRWFKSFPGFSRDCFLEGHYAGRYSIYNYIQQESTFWRKELWQKAGGAIHTEYKLAGDFYLWNEFYKHTQLFGVANPLSLFRLNSQQKSSDISFYIQECLSILKKDDPTRSFKSAMAPRSFRDYEMSAVPFFRKRPKKYTGDFVKLVHINTEKSGWQSEKHDFSF